MQPRRVLMLILVAVFSRTLVDSFASGVFFALALKFGSPTIGALVSAFSLFLSFLLSPIFGHLIDSKLLVPRMVGILYIFSGLAMFLFLADGVEITTSIFVNIFVISLFGIPSVIYINYLSSIVIKNRPAGGYSWVAAVNTTAAIFGSIVGAFFIENDEQLVIWVWSKIGLTIITGVILAVVFVRILPRVLEMEDVREPVARMQQGPKMLILNFYHN
ncbi:MAG: hypothetical protein ACXAE3_17135, partial [Candidatus Kariarchaeaceae archaeon]